MLVLRKETPGDFLDEIRKLGAQNSKDSDGIPTICMAVGKFRSAYLVEELIKDGAEVNAYSCLNRLTFSYKWQDCYKRWGDFSAIHLAVSLGYHEIVRFLLKHGADLKSKTTKGVEVLDFILDPYLRCVKNEAKITEADDLELLKLMNEKGLDLYKKDERLSRSVLHRAIFHNCPDIVRFLISTGCDVNCVEKYGCTPLHECRLESLECPRLLLENNANPNAKDDGGNTVYHHIVDRSRYVDRPNPVRFLDLLHKFQIDPNIQNNAGETALHLYVRNINVNEVNIEVFDFMLKNGADPNVNDIFQRTPVYHLVLLLQARNPHVLDSVWIMLIKLVHFGANLNYRDITGTPLLHVLVNRCLLFPKYFDEKFWIEILDPHYKIDVNVQDFHNRTVLHLVSAKGDWKLGEILLSYGGNKNILDCDGNTPLDVAILCKQWEYTKNSLLWPSVVDKSRQFIGSYRDLKSNIKSNDNITDSSCNNNNASNQNSTSNSSNKNNSNKNHKLNSNLDDDDNIKDYNNWLQFLCGNENQSPFGVHRKLQRSSSITSFKPIKQETECIVPLGACVKWTKDKLDSVAKFLAKHGNEFNSSSIKQDRVFWDSEYSSVPRIPETFLTQINNTSLLHLCDRNSLDFHMFERCNEEHCRLAQQVFSLVTDLVNKCSEIDPRMSNELHWTGSSSEGTKMWCPDEFDFLMELVELRGCCYIKDDLVAPREAILSENKGTLWSNLCSGRDLNVLSPSKLKNYLSVLLWKAAFELDKERYPDIDFNLCRYDDNLNCFFNDTKVGLNLTVSWKGEIYKNLTVSIDLTPGVPIVISEKQMLDLRESARKELCDRCIHVVPYEWKETGWRASFSLIEVKIVRNLTHRQISLYKCLKFFRDLHKDKFDHIPSYHLKTFLLGTLFRDPDEEYLQMIESESFFSSTCLVLHRLKQIADEMLMQHFFLNFSLLLSNFDMRWCKSSLDYLKSIGP